VLPLTSGRSLLPNPRFDRPVLLLSTSALNRCDRFEIGIRERLADHAKIPKALAPSKGQRTGDGRREAMTNVERRSSALGAGIQAVLGKVWISCARKEPGGIVG
jgi:hypothetical protein